MLNVSRHDPARDSQPARHPLDAVRRGAPDQPVFCFELGSPECWLAAERILPALAVVAEWLPVAFGPDPAPDREALARRAAALGVLPPRWPAAWPPDTGTAMRAVTYARQSGKTVAFALAAFRQAFAA